jgi:hypothetical protein
MVGPRAVRSARRGAALRRRGQVGHDHGRRLAHQPLRLAEEFRLPRPSHLHLQRDRHASGRLRDRRRQQRPQRREPEVESAGALDVGLPAGHDAARADARLGRRPHFGHAREPRGGSTRRRHRGRGTQPSGGVVSGPDRRLRPAERASRARAHARLRQHLGRRHLRLRLLAVARHRRDQSADEPQVRAQRADGPGNHPDRRALQPADRPGPPADPGRGAGERGQAGKRHCALPVGDPPPVHRPRARRACGCRSSRRARSTSPAARTTACSWR